MTRVLAIVAAISTMLVLFITVAILQLGHEKPSVAVVTEVAQPKLKLSMCVVAGSRKICADPVTVNILPVAIAFLSKIARVCTSVNVTLADGREVDLCKIKIADFTPRTVYVLLALTNKSETSIYDYNITGVKVTTLPLYTVSGITAIFGKEITENITFNEIGLFYVFDFGPVMIAHWVLPQNITVTAPDTVYVIVNFTGFARFAMWPIYGTKWLTIYSTMYCTIYYGVGTKLDIVVEEGGQTKHVSKMICLTARDYVYRDVMTGVAAMKNKTNYELLYSLIRTAPFNLTEVHILLGMCYYETPGGKWHWAGTQFEEKYVVNKTAPNLGADVYGFNIRFTASLT